MVAANITAPFIPLSWQRAPFLDRSPVILLTGSAGGGKSQLAAEKVHGFMLNYPGATGLMMRKAREYAIKSLVPIMQTVIGDDPTVRLKKSDGFFEYTNGSRLYWGGMKDQSQREALRSMRGKVGEPDIVWLEEANAFTRADFDEALARLRGHAAGWTQIILSTNPDIPQHWIYADLIVGGGAKVYYSSARDNTSLPESYFDRLDSLTGVLRDRLRDGKWVRAEGAVYDEYDPAVHLIDPFIIPASWERIRSVDFGYTNPFVCQWWAVDPDGRMYLYREMVRRRRLVEDLTPDIIRLSLGEYVGATVADHDAEDRATMERHGIGTAKANKAVGFGIQKVKERLQAAGDGRPRLFILRGAVDADEDDGRTPAGVEGEITAYSWAKAADGKANKEEPVKLYDHSMDAMRYAVMHFDGGGWLIS